MSAAAPNEFPRDPSPNELAEEFNGPAPALSETDLINLLRSYFDEAEEARQSGDNARDREWELNHDAYWGRYPVHLKAEWQAREHMPEVANFVDRNTAGMRAAVTGSDWHEVSDPIDKNNLLGPRMNEFLTLLLAHSGRNATGQDVGFDATFADCVKSGNLMMAYAAVTIEGNRVRVGAVDAREVFLDPKGRGLYRVRRYEVDKHELQAFKGGNFNDAAIDKLQAQVNEDAVDERRVSSGGNEGEGERPDRTPVVLKEFLCKIINREGELVAENQLVVMANDKFIIRGPEPNPFWHGKDWLVGMAPIQVPFSQYGRSNVEVYRQLANTFTELTNLLIDAAFASSINAHMVWLEALSDPSQIQNGIAPGVVITAAEEWPAGKEFVQAIQTGTFSPALVTVWQGIKSELREGAFVNETTLGQTPPQSDITATQINATSAGTNALNTSIATDYDTRFLAPILELVFMTGLQIYDPEEDPALAVELGEGLSNMIVSQRETFRDRAFTFTAFGITAAVERGTRLQKLLQFMQIIGQNEQLTAEFSRKHSLSKLITEIMRLTDVDPKRLEKSEQEQKEDEARAAEARAQLASQGPQPGIASQPSPVNTSAPGGAQ